MQGGHVSGRLAAFLPLIPAGCASLAGNQDPRIQELQEASGQIAARERQSVDAAIDRANNEFFQIAATRDASSEQRVQAVKVQRSLDSSRRKVEGDHENLELSSREKAEYERRAREENDRATLRWL